MSLINSYWILQNSRVAAFTFLEFLCEKVYGGWVKNTSPPPNYIKKVKKVKREKWFAENWKVIFKPQKVIWLLLVFFFLYAERISVLQHYLEQFDWNTLLLAVNMKLIFPGFLSSHPWHHHYRYLLPLSVITASIFGATAKSVLADLLYS